MSVFAEVRQLLLDTKDIGWHVPPANIIQTTYYANPFVNPNMGVVNNRLTEAVWQNIDLVEVLGEEMWNTYDKFNISIRSFTVNNVADLGPMVVSTDMFNDRSLYIGMTMPWVNNYNIAKKCTERECIVAAYSSTNTGASEGFTQYYNDNAVVFTFGKREGRKIDIRVRLIRTVDGNTLGFNWPTQNTSGASPAQPTNLVHWSLLFDIHPVLSSRVSKKNNVAF
jgi:hypothetical protein